MSLSRELLRARSGIQTHDGLFRYNQLTRLAPSFTWLPWHLGRNFEKVFTVGIEPTIF